MCARILADGGGQSFVNRFIEPADLFGATDFALLDGPTSQYAPANGPELTDELLQIKSFCNSCQRMLLSRVAECGRVIRCQTLRFGFTGL